MNTKIITAIAMACVMCSCSSMYKATSTPDDVYYSPSPSVKVKDAGNSDDQYEDYVSSNDDRYLRMKVQNRSLWSGIDDYSYWQDSRYDFGYSCNSSRFALMNSFYSPYGYNFYSAFNPGYGFGLGYGYYGFGGGGYWNSPYQTVVLYKNPRTYFGGNTNKSNLTAYRNIQYNNGAGYKANSYNNNNGFVNGNTNTRNNTYYNNNTNSSQPARSFNAGSSNNNAGGRSGGYSSAGSSAPASRPTRH